jgi:hypothetical protein
MVNDNIKIEIEMKDSNSMFAIKKIIGYRIEDNWNVGLTVANDEGNERNSLIFNTNLEGFETVSRIIGAIEELNLGKQEEVEVEEESEED